MRALMVQYVESWKSQNVVGVLDTLTEDCVITECYGPVYRGKSTIQQWMRTWFAEGGEILQWDIQRWLLAQDGAAMEWIFRCRWQDHEAFLDGATVALFHGGKIASLREYATTAPLYDGHGTWQR